MRVKCIHVTLVRITSILLISNKYPVNAIYQPTENGLCGIFRETSCFPDNFQLWRKCLNVCCTRFFYVFNYKHSIFASLKFDLRSTDTCGIQCSMFVDARDLKWLAILQSVYTFFECALALHVAFSQKCRLNFLFRH